MSPSQRVTLGKDPPCPTFLLSFSPPYSAASTPSMPRSYPASPAPMVSSESPPRTSRQRRRRSFSSIVFHPQYLCQHGQRPGGPTVVYAAVSVVCVLWTGISPTPQPPDSFSHRAILGGLEVREGAADEGEEVGEGLGREGREPAVEGPPESGHLQQDKSAPPQRALDPRGGLRRGDGRREREPREPLQPVLIEDACLEKQPAAPAAHEGVDAFVLRKRRQDGPPSFGHAWTVQQVDALFHAADAPGHLPSSVVVKGGARAGEGGEAGQVGVFGEVADAGGGGRLDGVAPDVGFDQGHRELGTPAQHPQLVERTAFAQDGARLAPVYAEQTQTVEQLAAGAAVLFAQVEVEVTLFGRRFQVQT